ncbi:MAG: hypothetical protein WA160_02250 [Pseudobdellovibrio sp.]
MIVIINDSLKLKSLKVRPIIGRYAWRIAKDVWIWPKPIVREEIIKELEDITLDITVIFIWTNKKSEFGYDLHIHGNATSRQTSLGFFNFLSER